MPRQKAEPRPSLRVERAPVNDLVWRLRLEGFSQSEIAATLNDVRKPGEKRYTTGAIAGLLHRERKRRGMGKRAWQPVTEQALARGHEFGEQT